jgi:hypothetical protein
MNFTRTILALGLTVAMTSPAIAQDDVEIDYDKYSKVSEQKLMLTGSVSSSLPANNMKSYMFELGLGRFNTTLTTKDPNDASVNAWCEQAIKDTQTKRDEVDGETGDAIVTLKAKMERCSQVFMYDLDVSHSCKKVKPKKGKPSMACTVKGKFTAYKFAADQSSGSLAYTTDTAFGRGGKVVKTASWTSSSTITKNNSQARAKKSALSGATTWAGRWMSRGLRDIKEFQISAPIVAVKGGTAYSCLAKDVVEQDLPFHVVFNSSEGEQKVGFVKARKRYDGCTLTPSLSEKQEGGEKVEIKPMESQIILGDPKASMTLWEMPTMHLNVGLGGGIMPSIAGEESNGAMGVSFLAEYNGGRYLGLSEVHQYAYVSYGLAPRENLDALFVEGFGVNPKEEAITAGDDPGEMVPFARASLGILKRMYFRALFVELGAGVSASYYLLDKIESFGGDLELGIISYGGEGMAAVGMQLSPRLLLRAQGGYHFGIAAPTLSQNGEEKELSPNAALEQETGIFAGVHILYTI